MVKRIFKGTINIFRSNKQVPTVAFRGETKTS